ncbi:hypothetical protein BJ165DRAFT_1411276 [Panaeolus papilionaceus]|nr:hypothetical protein BJ165DRAFT_1411276 [Panaeolus papilionaceus]
MENVGGVFLILLDVSHFGRKWRAVNGSVGIVVPNLNSDDQEEVWNVIVAHKDPMEASAPWSWQSVNFNDIHFTIKLDELLTVKDIQRFSGCDLVNEYTLSVLFERIYRTNIRPGACVIVTTGEFVGMIGEVVMSLGTMAELRFEDGTLEPVLLCDLRRNFVVGDQAVISTLLWRGITGWVINVEVKHITIWSESLQNEYRVAAIEAEFFTPSLRHIASLPPRIKHRNITEFNIYERFKGRMVYITGCHPHKGQRGHIKDAHPDGRFWIQMESMLQRNEPTIFKHSDISLIEEITENLLPIPQNRSSVAYSKPIKAPFISPDSQTASKSATDTNDGGPSGSQSPCSQIKDLPVVDSSTTFPETDPIEPASNVDPYWLVEACFSHRIKLAHVHDLNHIVQLLGRGSASGHIQVRKPGRVLRKGEVNPTFPNDVPHVSYWKTNDLNSSAPLTKLYRLSEAIYQKCHPQCQVQPCEYAIPSGLAFGRR